MQRPLQHLIAGLALLVVHTVTAAGAPIFKCQVNGSITLQNTPCLNPETQAPATAQRPKTEVKKRLEAEAAKTPAAPASPPAKPLSPVAPTAAAPNSVGSAGYRCDGRQYCSQMRSCQEATFFLRNCPVIKMDGDRDGIPCEDEWCGH